VVAFETLISKLPVKEVTQSEGAEEGGVIMEVTACAETMEAARATRAASVYFMVKMLDNS